MSANNNRFPHLIQLPHGAVLFKHWLDIEAQKQVVEMAFSLVCLSHPAEILNSRADAIFYFIKSKWSSISCKLMYPWVSFTKHKTSTFYFPFTSNIYLCLGNLGKKMQKRGVRISAALQKYGSIGHVLHSLFGRMHAFWFSKPCSKFDSWLSVLNDILP